ncbi:uncharacterized protein B0T23DRAFT_365690 [Neurospora hispaniola]|uniref:Methyltransferase domain-containing protein n=1 Tax=Neurospora hispaniola TaxID=588809 RepID=A0AAJ0I0T9_9PEZI|nr:hypothetical protein B0T23DRAFT_365690 [Neurospora hispaniola]
MAIPEMDSEEESKITTLITCFPHDQSLTSLVQIPRFRQRLSILSVWSIPPGSRVLDIGCGQGDSSLVLALELGPTCHVTGIDSAPPDYGTPLNISESQEKILQSALGDRLSFYNQVDAATFFNSSSAAGDGDSLNNKKTKEFDVATACHSLFYFPSSDSVVSLFQELAAANIRKVYVAEYDSKHAPFPVTQTPHILAAKAQALYFAYKSEADSRCNNPLNNEEQQQQQQQASSSKKEEMPLNVRAAPDVEAITKAAQAAGFKVAREGKCVRGGKFEERVKKEGFAKEKEEEILGVVKEVKRAYEEMERGGVDKVRCMDVWWAVFELE